MSSSAYDLLKRRDLANFVLHRDSRWTDDEAIGELLVHSFSDTYARKLPQVQTNDERRAELRNVASRRACGSVRVLELGYRIIGTYALMRPGSAECLAWDEGTAYLRCLAIDPDFHGLKLAQLMLHDAEALAKSWGVARIALHVQNGADGVARLYQGYGFRRDLRGDCISCGCAIEGYVLDLTRRLDPYSERIDQ